MFLFPVSDEEFPVSDGGFTLEDLRQQIEILKILLSRQVPPTKEGTPGTGAGGTIFKADLGRSGAKGT